MLFRVIVHTGLRLREAYRLRLSDIKFPLRTIHVRTSKTEASRDIPTTRQLEGWLKDYVSRASGPKDGEDLIFPFWDGVNTEESLDECTVRLSRRFGNLFLYAGCFGITEHDLRHEATCRWVEMRNADGSWKFRTEEVRKITGHKSESMFMRYLSLRGSDLAARMG
jgi:integrase